MMRTFRHLTIEWGFAMLGVVIVMLGASGPAKAVLGGKVASVAADQAHMKASLKVTSNGRFQVQELQDDGGNVVREFVSSDGNVFGVAWTGRFVPEYSQLLGSYTEWITKAAQSRRNHRAPLVINEPGFVFSAFGHMRFYFGRAYIPSMVPAGVLVEEIR
jgi:hypothetical protein